MAKRLKGDGRTWEEIAEHLEDLHEVLIIHDERWI